MATEDKDLEAVREWLISEVKLKQYFDKLVLHGFKTLKTCSVIDENALNMLEIKPPYHRKRFLLFSKSLRERLYAEPNPKEDICLPREEQNHDFETGNEQQNNIITTGGEDESKSSLPYLNISDVNRGFNDKAPALPPKKMGKPPPIPPRSDLEPEDTKPIGADSASGTALPVAPVPLKKAAPSKPPRKSSLKNLSREMELDGLINSDLQGESPGRSWSDREGDSRRTGVCQPLNGSAKEQHATYSKNILSICDSSKQQSLNGTLYKSSSKERDDRQSCSYGSVKGEENQHMLSSIEPTRPAPRPAPKPPTRLSSPMTSSLKKPVPVPRTRIKSEEAIDVSLIPSKIGTDSNNISERRPITRRPDSFSVSGSKQLTVTSEKSSTLPRYPQSEQRVPPPLPPARQITADLTLRTGSTREPATSSVIATDKASFPNMPQSAVHKDNPCVNADYLVSDEIGAFQSAPSQGSVTSNAISPTANTTGSSGQYSLVGTDQRKSFVADTIYETVDSTPGQDQESNDVDYESDDCLSEEAVDDLLMVDSSKGRGESVDSTGGSNDARASKSILSPRVRKSEGYLWKQGGQQGNKGWRKRWFIFDGMALKYYKDKDSLNESLHIIPVSQVKDIENVKDTKRASFKVITPNRTFLLASENLTEMNLWSQTLMEAILMYKADNNSGKTGGEMSDPDKEGWLKKQGHNVVADWRKRYLAIKEDKICYYDTYEDFVYATAINCINAALAKVKTAEGHRNRFLIITPNKSYSFQAETETEAASWIVSIETAIQKGLGDRTILDKVYENPSNRFCADCGMKDPVWASVNFCVCVCAHCIGAHRNLGVHCSKPRSILMDERIWNPSLLELMVKIGNAKANLLLEHKLPDDDKITPETDSSSRREFIYSKYWEKKYCKYHQSFGNSDELGKVLQKTVVTDDYMTTLELILNKVDLRYISPDGEDERTPLELAEETGQTLQAELLRQNGAEGGKLDRQISYEDLSAAVSNELSHISPAEVVYEKEGFLYKKEGSWRKRWFLLKERDLKFTRGPHDREELGTISLRTVTSLVKCPKGEPLQLDIVTVDKTHSLKAETDEELEAWYSTLRSKQVFGVLLSHQELGSDGIPHLVAKCLQFVESYGGLEMEGIYRVNGGQLTMKKLVTSFDQDAGRVLLTLDECGVHDVTGVLKQYLRCLPDPVVPGDMYDAFIRAGMNPDNNARLHTIKDLIAALPKVNHDTLKEIVFHLTKVVSLEAVNKMRIPNIAMIFGPTLMSNEQTGRMDNASINQEFSIIGDMITYFYWLFDVKEEEVRKDQIMQDALQKIRRLQTEAQPSSEEFTLDIYVNQTSENPCRLKVSSEMTAQMVCAEIVKQRELPPDVNWALFEVIGHGAMERAFQVREKVLAAAKWGSGNYLIVKENYIAEQIAPYVGSTLSIEGPLHIRDPKSKNWRQSSVCLKNGYMLVDKGKSFFKAIKSDKSEMDQWPLHKLTLYVGIPAEKSTKGLDTSCAFTVVIKTDQEDFTRYMCAKDKRDMYRWLAAVLNMKHPEGIWSDPSQRDTVGTFASESKGKQAEDMPLFLGRQSFSLRRKGSSKHIVEELRLKQKSLKRPADRGPRHYPQGPS